MTPVLAGYGFIPSNAVVALSGADQAIATPFDGTVLTYCIFGQVTDDKGVGAVGVSVNLDPVGTSPPWVCQLIWIPWVQAHPSGH